MFALLLALLAAVMHATWNLFIKDSSDRISTVVLMGAIGAAIYAPLVFIGQGPPGGVWDHLAVSAGVHTLYYLSLISAYSRVDFSVAYPVARGVAPALVAVGGWLFLDDQVVAGEWVAIGVIVSALLFLAWSPGHHDGVGWAVATGLAIAAYTVVDAGAVRESGNALGYTATLIAVVAVLLLPVALHRSGRAGLWAAARARPIALVAAAILHIGAYMLVLIAATRAPVGLVAAVRESSVVIGAIAGVVLLGEPFGRRRILGAVAVAGSIMALGLV